MADIIPIIRPSYKQHLAYEKLRDNKTLFLLFGGGAEGGKSWLGAEWLITNCYFYPGSKWFLGRNQLTRLMGSSYQSFLKICRYHGIPDSDWKFNGQYHYVIFRCRQNGCENKGKFDDHGSRIDLIDLAYKPTDPMFQRFGSYEFTGGWIEEAGEVHFLAFEILKTRVGRWMNKEFGLLAKILITCNPEQNWLYRIFYKPAMKGTLPPEYAFIQSLYKDNPYTATEAEHRLNQVSDPIMRARLKQGLWEFNNDELSLLDYDSIIDLFTNVLPESEQQEKYFSADVARYGSDKVVMGRWKGFNLIDIQSKQKRGIDQTANDIKEQLRIHSVPYSHTIIDDDGVGGGVVDFVRGVKGFVGNSSALAELSKASGKKENYKNLRSQCGFMLAAKIKSHEVAISADIDEATKEMIIEDLQQLKRVETPVEAPLQLIPKEEIKDALGRSPDFSDMMMMRMYFELRKPLKYHQTDEVGGVLPYLEGIG